MQLPDNYILIEKDVKHARIQVNENGLVRIIVPFNFSEEDIQSLIVKKQKWIDKHSLYFKEMSKIELQRNQILLFGNRYSYYYDPTYERKIIINHEHKTIQSKKNLLDLYTQEKWLKSIAKKHLTNRIEELSGKLDLKYNKLYIRNQRKKWGNCSTDQNISLNWRLIKAPLFVIDYLIVHELVHTLVMNHTHKFWTLLKSYYPDYKDAINWLDKYGNSL